MKQILFILLFAACAWGQEIFPSPAWETNIITDSIVWRITDVVLPGDSLCNHDWLEGEFSTAKPGYSCLVYHNGTHCSYNDKVKSRICRKCHRKERLREQWYEHREEPPKTEYEKLNEELFPAKEDTISMKDSPSILTITPGIILRESVWTRRKVQ